MGQKSQSLAHRHPATVVLFDTGSSAPELLRDTLTEINAQMLEIDGNAVYDRPTPASYHATPTAAPLPPSPANAVASQHAHGYFRALYDRLPFGLFLVQGHHPLNLRANRQARKVLGRQLLTALRCYLQTSLANTNTGSAPRGLLQALAGATSEEEVCLEIEHAEHMLHLRYTPLHDHAGTQWGVVVQVQDITQAAAPTLTHEEVLCMASHELQSPLTVIKGYVDQLRWARAQQQPVPLDQALEAIERQVGRMQRLVHDVLELSAVSITGLQYSMREVALTTLLDSVLDDLAVAQRREILRALAPQISLYCDPLRIEQVVRNLVENACKYSPATTPITVTLLPGQDSVTLAVHDEGDGIPPGEIALIFDPFYRTHTAPAGKATSGFGLGLTLCQRIVEVHGGVITARSAPGGGSTFFVTLPHQMQNDEQPCPPFGV